MVRKQSRKNGTGKAEACEIRTTAIHCKDAGRQRSHTVEYQMYRGSEACPPKAR